MSMRSAIAAVVFALAASGGCSADRAVGTDGSGPASATAGSDDGGFAAASAAAASDPDAAARALVDLEVPPYPDALDELVGSCVSPSSDPEQVCSHGIAVVGRMSIDPDRSATPEFVVATRSLGRDGPKPRWLVTDALAHPDAGEGAYVQAGSCRIGGSDDPGVVALVADDPDAEWLRTTWARRLDFDSGRFAIVDPATVDCRNEGYGL